MPELNLTPEQIEAIRGLGDAPAAPQTRAERRAGRYLVDTGELPAGSAASYAGADWNKFITDYGGLIEKQMGSLSSTDMVDQAEKDARVVPQLMTGAVQRAVQRRGGMNQTQRDSLALSRGLNKATVTTDIMNNSRIDQRTRNTDTALQMSGLGTDVYSMGLDNVRESQGLAAQRRMNNDTAQAAYKSSLLSGGMTLGSAALAAFLM